MINKTYEEIKKDLDCLHDLILKLGDTENNSEEQEAAWENLKIEACNQIGRVDL